MSLQAGFSFSQDLIDILNDMQSRAKSMGIYMFSASQFSICTWQNQSVYFSLQHQEQSPRLAAFPSFPEPALHEETDLHNSDAGTIERR